jgi:hypothetical protein
MQDGLVGGGGGNLPAENSIYQSDPSLWTEGKSSYPLRTKRAIATLFSGFSSSIPSLRKILQDASSKIRSPRYMFVLAELLYSLNFVRSEPEIDELIPRHSCAIDLRI